VVFLLFLVFIVTDIIYVRLIFIFMMSFVFIFLSSIFSSDSDDKNTTASQNTIMIHFRSLPKISISAAFRLLQESLDANFMTLNY
jgi:hypothetical protein